MRKMGRRLVMVVVGAALCWVGQAGAAPGGLALCQANLNTSNANLATCTTNLNAAQQFPATGQTTCYDSSRLVILCASTGQDGEIQAGATLSYTDNGDGTVTDNNTKLVWEKKSDDSTIHRQDTFYTWANAFLVHIAGLNAGFFAGHTDWRLPNVKELQSIVNYETAVSPAVSPAFNTSCAASCTVLTCSCTSAANYWSSSTFASGPADAWFVDFDDGNVSATLKSTTHRVRAVRGGL